MPHKQGQSQQQRAHDKGAKNQSVPSAPPANVAPVLSRPQPEEESAIAMKSSSIPQPQTSPSRPTAAVAAAQPAAARRLATKESETSIQIQREEIEALSSIFGDDLRMDKPIWGNASFTILIRLLGQDSVGASLAHASVELGITYTAKYPKTPPTIEVKRPRNQAQSQFTLSDDELKNLKASVIAEAEKWAHDKQGDPFLFELIRLVQDYLAERSKKFRAPPSSAVQTTILPPAESAPAQLEHPEDLSLLEEEARARKREAWRQEQGQQGVPDRPAKEPTLIADAAKPVAKEVEQPPVHVLQPGKRGGRYATDYEDLGAVGRGGFGHVYKARNRLDGMIYAVKKIRLESDEAANRKTRNEATTLAKLVHPNIVRYFAAWLEEDDDENSDDEEESEEDEFSESEPSIMRPASSFTGGFLSQGDDDNDFGFEWDDNGAEDEHSNEDEESSSGYGTSNGSLNKQALKRPATGGAGGKADATVANRRLTGAGLNGTGSAAGGLSARPRKQTLYIVMEFVPRTVRSLIDTRELLGKDNRCFELIREILEALSCVHELGIIHQDIKPENLLIDAQGRVKLGDFGLAVDQEEDRAGSEVGTTYYRAPEVGKGRWDEKCDIFSLGVVVVEIFSPPTDTSMERHKMLTNLRLEPPVLPSNLAEEAAVLARQMLQKDPTKRPSASEALKVIPGHVLVEHAVDTVVKTLVPASNAYHRLLKHLFSQVPSAEMDVTFDYDPSAAEATSKGEYENMMRWSSRAYSELSALGALPIPESLVPVNKEIVTTILEGAATKALELVGCCRFKVPILTPAREEPDPRRRLVTLMDPSGVCVTLPHATLTRNFARFVALNREVRFLKRYEIGWTYSRAGGGGQPNAHKQLCVDVATQVRDLGEDGLRALLVELVDTTKEVLSTQTKLVSSAGTGFTLEIGHTQLLPALFDLAKVPSEVRSTLIQAIKSREFFRDWKQAQDFLVTECKCPIRVVQALKFCLPIGKRTWVSGTNGELAPPYYLPVAATSHHPPHQRSRTQSFRDDSGGQQTLGERSISGASTSTVNDGGGDEHGSSSGATEFANPLEEQQSGPVHQLQGRRAKAAPFAAKKSSLSMASLTAQQQQTTSVATSSSMSTSSAPKHPLDALMEHVQTSFPGKVNEPVLAILREMATMVAQFHHSVSRLRIVLWADSPQDVTGIFVKCMIRQRRAIVRAGGGGKSALSYEEGPEFVCADGGRFDHLFQVYARSSASRDLAGVSLRLYLDRIAKLRAYFTLESMLKRPLIHLCFPSEKDAARFDSEDRARVAARIRTELPGVGVEWAHPAGLSGDALLAMSRDAGARVMISKVGAPASVSSTAVAGAGSSLNPSASLQGGMGATLGGATAMHPVSAATSGMPSSLGISSTTGVMGSLSSSSGLATIGSAFVPPSLLANDVWRVRGWAFPASAEMSSMQGEFQLYHVGVFTDKRCETWQDMIKTVSQMLAYNKLMTSVSSAPNVGLGSTGNE